VILMRYSNNYRIRKWQKRLNLTEAAASMRHLRALRR